eukprot:CAMPEP_0172860096 /NCGR_PEP_ID=MMETSP1075-20121228/71892_1 /TAXON_ID=2916 /ORGANISM="Ceratium fusus, Strain PA161109" /LENGTH=53 /DNA_ID=CAMNT_0013708081 /DNA_START=322 /DNA_END=483 /DNA_ORIENTATION=-
MRVAVTSKPSGVFTGNSAVPSFSSTCSASCAISNHQRKQPAAEKMQGGQTNGN